MLLPFNASAFSNILSAPDCAAQCKALVSPFDEFDGKPDDVHQYIAHFTQRCVETGVIEDFSFVICGNPAPSDVDHTDPIEKAAWNSDPWRFRAGNFLLDASKATIEKVQDAHDNNRSSLQKFSSPPDPVKMLLASKQLVSFQNR
jgi:hypothetical protein